ncbi:hypothetical protein RRG08_013745 [Elysia crispata]|uniref:Integrase zinc-binding domain-containing protein n=1 Tax=Elysia crispata TaxID=231223 RepID=A0AAE1DKW7_9GAST|nr:hypothetical protein RRG08_013745 [Elysia crispata]
MVASASPIPPIDLARMAEEQLRDPKVAELRKQPGALKLKEVNLDGCILLCDVSTSRPRPIVPPLWTKTIFEAIHNLSHPGHKPTTRAISARYVWPGLKREVKNMILTYGTNLRIPGDFFPSNSAERISPGSTFVRDLQENFRKLSPLSPVHHSTTKKYLSRDLMSAEQVYVRHDAHRGPLVRPYDGPFKVLCHSDKHFDILRNNKSTRVSIDRLKPAYSADPKFPPPAVHPHDQAPRVDDNSRSETVSDSSVYSNNAQEGSLFSNNAQEGSVYSNNAQEGSLYSNKAQEGSVYSNNAQEGSVYSNKAQEGSVYSNNAQEGSVYSDKAQEGSVYSNKAQEGSVYSDKAQEGS